MTMLNVSFNTMTQKLDVVDQSATPVVLALDTYSNPAVTSGSTAYGRSNYSATSFGTFDGTQPWAVVQNKAFSRQLGWNPGSNASASAIQAAYGSDASIWIELISESAGIETYKAVGKYGVNSAGTLDANSVPVIDANAHGYDPIFGTAGSSAKWQWDYQMDHNVYAIPSTYLTTPNQPLTATYKVYIGDSQGNEILNGDGSSASSIETWTWQDPASVPEPTTVSLLAAGAAGRLARTRRGLPGRLPGRIAL